MLQADIFLPTPSKAHDFAHLCDRVEGTVELTQGAVCVDGRSIIGIFSLDRARAIHLCAALSPQDEAFFAAQLGLFSAP